MAQLTKDILRLSHTEHSRITAYHPRTNGLARILNKTIADMIAMRVDVEHKICGNIRLYVRLPYNTAVQETTEMTSFQQVHHRKVTTMLDAMLPHDPADDGTDDVRFITQRAGETRQLA